MPNTQRIFSIEPSFDENRPEIDFELAENGSQDWDMLNEVLDGDRCVDDYAPFEVVITAPGALEWDYYTIPGTLGLMSSKSQRLLEPFAKNHFMFLEARLNATPYYLLMRSRPLDCLDREESILELFHHDPTRIKRVKKYHFKMQLIADPLVFCIPESIGSVFATLSVCRIIEREGLRGFFMEPVAGFD